MLTKVHEIMQGEVEHGLLHLLSDELSEAEAAAISSRVRRDPKYREELDRSLETLAAMEELADDTEITAISDEFRLLLNGHRFRRSAAFGMAAGVLVALGAALIYFSPWSGSDDSHRTKYFTQVGEQKTIELDDGSIATLNTGSELVVDYSESVRQLLLQRGEAFFEVVDDPQRPFTVDLGLRSVTAIGTAFNVRKEEKRYEVAVLEGTIALHEATEDWSETSPAVSIKGLGPRRVEAGWVAEFDVRRGELTAFQPESIDRYRDWRSGMLGFYHEPLSQVVRELNRYSRRKILIEDASVKDLHVYTAVSVQDIEAALDGLDRALPIEVTKHYDRIVITASAESGN